MEQLIVTRRKWSWRGIRVQVPKPGRCVPSLTFAVTSPYSFTKTISTMQTSNGEGVDSNKNSVNPTNDARHASTSNSPLTDSQAEFWYLIECQGYKELAQSLKMVHDLALYHSDVPFNGAEKSALFDVNLLVEGFQKMAGRA